VGLVAVRLRLGALPDDVTMRHVLGLAALAGIGFTVSLFIAELAYEPGAMQDGAKIGVLIGSVIAAVLGSLVLLRGRRVADEQEEEA
jgi:Na+:H+ antiporter, NhaA family